MVDGGLLRDRKYPAANQEKYKTGDTEDKSKEVGKYHQVTIFLKSKEK